MKKTKLYGMMIVGLGVPFLCWALALSPGLPRSVYLYELGRLFGLFAFVLVFFQYLLSSKIKAVERGIGLDVLLRTHKVCGIVALILAMAHPSCIVISEKLQGYGSPFGFLKLMGVCTLLILCGTVVFAGLYQKLRLSYDQWKRMHTAGFVLFPLGFIHSFFLGSGLQKAPLKILWSILALVYLAIIAHKIVKGIRLKRHPYRIKGVTQETHDTWSLFFEGRHGDFVPGQFMILQIKNDLPNEAHPFTITSTPMHTDLSITVKAVGDFTSCLSEIRAPSIALIDMPYGTFSFLNHPAEEFVFIAGGIGITPFMSMLRYIRDRDGNRPILLLWANKHEKDIAFRNELHDMQQDMPFFKVIHVLSRQDDWPGEKGHVDAETLRKYVKDFSVPHFFVCGPVPMMQSIVSTLRNLGVPGSRIHTERFALR
jgi:predicted ferric reductase